MSDSAFDSKEMRTSYTEFMNAYEKCRKAFGLGDVFFRDKLFFNVLSEILEKFIESEKKPFKCIEGFQTEGEQPLSKVSDELETQSPDNIDQISKLAPYF